MSELINNSRKRVDELKRLIQDLHKGVSVEETKTKLKQLMGSVPYGEVVQAEEELISEGLDREEVLKFCDIHTEALKGNIDTSAAKSVPSGHPVDTFSKENEAIQKEIDTLRHLFHEISNTEDSKDGAEYLLTIQASFNSLMDIDKHYIKKENLIFPYLEKNNITGPPMVMWGKHDEVRGFLKSSLELVQTNETVTTGDINDFIELMFNPTLKAVEEMIYKEEQILFPMCLDTLTDNDWYEIFTQSDEIGYCLYVPETEWTPDISITEQVKPKSNDKIKFSTGSFTKEELEGMISALPVDITFVNKDDTVKFFSHGADRIFDRSKAILGRQVQHCHPPSSVNIVNKIVDDFKSGRQEKAVFWIHLGGKFVHIAYYAVKDPEGNYLGTVEVTQDINDFKKAEGERRLLTYDK